MGVTAVYSEFELREYQGRYRLPMLTYPAKFYSEMGHLAFIYVQLCQFFQYSDDLNFFFCMNSAMVLQTTSLANENFQQQSPRKIVNELGEY
jgi:hypothetical protein